jgi:transitional endoplasmic reticulum ATPase
MAAKKLNAEDVDIRHDGTMITLPETPERMKLRTAVAVLEQKIADEEQVMDVHEILDAHPHDALVAMNIAMKERFGWTSAVSQKVQSFFGTREIKPDLLTVKTGPKDADSVQVLSGQFNLPNVEFPINTSPHKHEGKHCLAVHGQARKRDWGIIRDLVNDARAILRERSIFKNKAIQLHTTENGSLNYNKPPTFLETDDIVVDDLILNQEELQQVEATLWAPITNTQACIKHGIPLNRGILLEGTFGTGKTMTAHVTSKVCVDNGWTYIMLDDVRALADALIFAQRYQPAVVFAEDIDRVANQRDQRGNDLLNTIDGVLTKNSKVITVLTTNHVEKLETAMLRPGRLDAVISVKAPGPDAVKRLVQLYARDLMKEGETLDKIGALLAGNIPATIREVVERSKLSMIYRGDNLLIENDLIVSGHNMQAHLDLLKAKPAPLSQEEILGAALRDVLEERTSVKSINQIAENVSDIMDHVC